MRPILTKTKLYTYKSFKSLANLLSIFPWRVTSRHLLTIEEGGDIGLFITLVPKVIRRRGDNGSLITLVLKVLQKSFLILWLKNFGDFKLFLIWLVN